MGKKKSNIPYTLLFSQECVMGTCVMGDALSV